MKRGEATCRQVHSEEWAAGRVNPCADCYIAELEEPDGA